MNYGQISLGLFLILIGIIMFVSGTWLGAPAIILGLLIQLKGRNKIDRIFSVTKPEFSFECNAIRIGVVAFWTLFLLSLMAYSFEEGSLPPEIAAFADSQLEDKPWIAGFTIGFLIINLIASIGVFLIKPWGRALFAAGFLGMVLLNPFLGVSVSTPLLGTVEMLWNALSGMIICMTGFYPVFTDGLKTT